MKPETRSPSTDAPSKEDLPLLMSDCESLEKICNYEELYHHKAEVEEQNVYNLENKPPTTTSRTKPITKIFKDRAYSPCLADIKEVEERCKDDFKSPYYLPLSQVHFDRALYGGYLEKDRGRKFRRYSWKAYHRGKERSTRRANFMVRKEKYNGRTSSKICTF